MTEQVRYRINRSLVKKAERVCGDLGMTPTQAVSMFFAQLVKLGALPFRPSNFPALEEYGATVADAETAEAKARKELDADEKAGRLVTFKGKLPS
jgi:addiction module RelB/DinJ family antitoxin